MAIPEPRDDNGGSATVTRRIDQARPTVVYGLLAILMAAVFVPMSFFRLIDDDEGAYLLVSRLVVEGRLPYHDFFYPQMFLLPYVYGAWMKLVGYSWYGARLLSAFFSIALGLLLYRQAAHLAGARVWGVLAAVLFTFTSLAFGWYPIIKTFVLPTLLLFAAYAVLSTPSRWKWLASGALLGLATDCRVYVIAVVPAFVVELYLTEEDVKHRVMQLARFGVGLVLALLPNELFFLIEPDTFLFNIVWNQVIRTDLGFLGGMKQKIKTVRQLLAIDGAEGVTSFQFLLIFFLNVVAWVSAALSRERPALASTIAVSLLLVSLVPTPVYAQYFCMPIPFLVINAVAFLAKLAREGSGPRLRHVLVSLTIIYVLVSPFDLYHYTLGRSNLADTRLPTIRAVGRAIDREVRAGRPFAISLWPGYLVETRASILPGMENHWAMMFSRSVTPHEAEQFKLMSYPALVRHFQQHTVDVIVIGDWASDSQWMRPLIVKNGYVIKDRIASTEIYTLQPDGRR